MAVVGVGAPKTGFIPDPVGQFHDIDVVVMAAARGGHSLWEWSRVAPSLPQPDSMATMPLRAAIVLGLALLMTPHPSNADSSSRELASYYERHMPLVDGGAAACICDGAN